MLPMIGRRLVLLVPTLLLVTFGVFSLITLVPGDPAVTLAGGMNASPDAIESVRTELGLDRPFIAQYFSWLGDAVRFDFGTSLKTGNDVMSEVGQRLPVTLSIVFGALVFGLLLGIPIGLVSGARSGGLVDRGLLLVTSLGLAIPNFVLALVLINFFAVRWGWFDAVGFTRLTDSPTGWLKSLVLPSVSLGLGVAARLARQLRAGVLDVLEQPYVRTAWAKGCPPSKVIGKHVLKNAALPTVTVAGLIIGGMLGGAVIIESIFGSPGIGEYMVRAISGQDLPVIQAVAVLFVLAFAVINLIVDLLYGWLNPKVQVE